MSKSSLLPSALQERELYSGVGEVEFECKLVCIVCYQNKGSNSDGTFVYWALFVINCLRHCQVTGSLWEEIYKLTSGCEFLGQCAQGSFQGTGHSSSLVLQCKPGHTECYLKSVLPDVLFIRHTVNVVLEKYLDRIRKQWLLLLSYPDSSAIHIITLVVQLWKIQLLVLNTSS